MIYPGGLDLIGMVYTFKIKELPMNRIVMMLCLVLLAGAGLTGCNTVDGAGKDMESVGDWVQDTF